MRQLAIACAFLSCLPGCFPRTLVKPNPGPCDQGIRYYRPKPYLFIKPLVSKDGTPVDGMVSLSMEMLPDFSEEYSIHIRSGFGINDTSVTLEDGWNLTQINVKVDSQADDNIQAVGDLLGNIPTLTGVAGNDSMVVRASNVPMGLYEAVLAKDPHGRKRLYGFRYIGFLPYASCPTTMFGEQCEPCGTDQLYGLVFEEGMMVFRNMSELPMHHNPTRIDFTAQTTHTGSEITVNDGFDP